MKIKRLDLENCVGLVIDVQDYFLESVGKDERRRLEKEIAHFVALLGYVGAPVVCTLERPLDVKGTLPAAIDRELSRGSVTLEKEFFDLTDERKIVRHLKTFGRKQMVVTGCETEVCVLQSVLGLLSLGYEVYVVEDLLFSATENTRSALERMRSAGAVLLTYKTLYHELMRSVRGSRSRTDLEKRFGNLPDRLTEL